MFRVTRYPMISKTESGRVGYRKKYRVAGWVRVPAGHWLKGLLFFKFLLIFAGVECLMRLWWVLAGLVYKLPLSRVQPEIISSSWTATYCKKAKGHTCKKREIVEIYLRNFFWIFRKILGWKCEINTAPKPSPEVAPSKMEVAPF